MRIYRRWNTACSTPQEVSIEWVSERVNACLYAGSQEEIDYLQGLALISGLELPPIELYTNQRHTSIKIWLELAE